MGKIEVAEEVSVQFEDSGIRPVARVERKGRAESRGGGYDARSQQPDLERQAPQHWGPLKQQDLDAKRGVR